MRILVDMDEVLAETDGTVRCHTAYNCTEACPHEIQITRTGDWRVEAGNGDGEDRLVEQGMENSG